MMTPTTSKNHEQRVRRIDTMLAAAGWAIQDRPDIDLAAGPGVAVRELQIKGGRADYALFLGNQLVGLIEAKKAGASLTSIEAQTRDYATKVWDRVEIPVRPLPFLYESTGVATWFTNGLNVESRPRRVSAFHRPETLREWLGTELNRRPGRLVARPSPDQQNRRNADASRILNKLWSYCNVLRDDGLSYEDYIEQLTYLLFLKMADEQTRPPWNWRSPVPDGYDWPSLNILDGVVLERHYRDVLKRLSRQPGLLGLVFHDAQQKIRDPTKLKHIVSDLIDKEQWVLVGIDIMGEAYEGLLERNAQDIKSGAGQHFTPRYLIDAMVACVAPRPGETVIDPACGTGGFLLAVHAWLIARHREMTPEQREHLRLDALRGVELVHGVTRMCAMNLLLHNIGPTPQELDKLRAELAARRKSDQVDAEIDRRLPVRTADSLRELGRARYDVVVTSPPFGRKSSIVGVLDTVREDFWAATSNTSLNFIQHIKSLLQIHGRAAVVVPDNVLFEGGAGEVIRRKLLEECNVHTLLRLPTGIFYAQGLKTNVLFFDRKPASAKPGTRMLWVYDLRTNQRFALKSNPMTRVDLDDFVARYQSGVLAKREPTWSESQPDGRWRAYRYEDLVARDKCSLDLSWLKDEGLSKSPASQLHELLLSMFSVEEFRRFLRYNVSVPDIMSMLPDPTASASALVQAAVDTLLRWGAVDETLFAALRHERTRRVAEIDTVARSFGLAGASQDEPRIASELPLATYGGPAALYRSKDAELASLRLLALYSAIERGASEREYNSEIAALHRSLRGEFSRLQPGDLLHAGRYLLLDARPRSSTPGVIWHAYDRRLEREVAIRLFNSTADDPSFRAYIRGQAHAMARLRHPYIAEVLDSGILDEPHYGYATEFLRGGRLLDRVEELRSEGSAVAILTAKLAEALSYVHTGGLIHGALEVRCIDFGADDEPRLRDFGLNSTSAQGRLSHQLLPFLAPEILAGANPSEAADQYGLAQIAAACLVGRPVPPSPKELADVQASGGVVGMLVAGLRRALDPDPEQRFPQMTAFKLTLMDAIAMGPGKPAAPTPALHRTIRRPLASLANPFSSGAPLDGTQVPGREEDIDRVVGLVMSHGSALLLGPRRTGKTSLLRSLMRALTVEHAVRAISLEPYPCDTPDALAVALAPELKDVPEPARTLAERLAREERWPVLLIDELGYLRNADVRIAPSVFSWLRAIGQGMASIVYAGSQNDWNQVLAVAKQQPGSSFGNDIVVHELGPLSRESALAFLADTAPPDVPIPAEPVGAWILEYCSTWPFYLQVMGHSLVDAARRGDRRSLKDRQALYELYELRLIRERSHVFEGRWNELDVRVRELILRERGRLPEFAALPLADRKLLRDAGIFNALNGGWLLEQDPPFYDWIRRKYDELREI